MDFHTIPSILKPRYVAVKNLKDGEFPYDSVYFKAKKIEEYSERADRNFHTIPSILKQKRDIQDT